MADTMTEQVAETGLVSDPGKSLFTVAITCPSCGGGISFAEGSPTVVCAHCERSYMVAGKKGVLHYRVPCRIEKSEAARRAGHSYAKNGDNPVVHLIDTRLVYVPFFRVRVTGGGWYIGSGMGTAYTWRETGDQQAVVIPREVKKSVVEGFFRNISFFVPAVDISELGLIGLWAKSTAVEMVPLDPDTCRDGEVYTPVKDAAAAAREAWATLISSAKPAGLTIDYFEAEKVAEQISLIYYPVWIVRLLLDGAPRRVVVDGIGGDILNARAVKGRRLMVLPGIAILAIIAFLATTIPFLLIIPGAVALYYLFVNGWRWFGGTLIGLFVSPWRGEEESGG